jgi:endogenous inhibitor of DNA gyrase (YacG/DUF329 family)
MIRYFFRDEDCAGHGNEEGTEMTNEQKMQIIALHKRGSGLTEVADKLGLPIGTVKSFCRRNQISSTAEVATQPERIPNSDEAVEMTKPDETCKRCGAQLEHTPHHRQKLFCSDKCRLAWWHENRHLAKGTSERTCPVCGITFAGDRERIYCCHSCYIKARYGRKGLLEVENATGTQ